MICPEIMGSTWHRAVGQAGQMDVSIFIGAQHGAVKAVQTVLERGKAPVWDNRHHCGQLVGGQYAQRRRGAVRLALSALAADGVASLVVCDDTVLGSAAGCVMQARLFAQAYERVEALADTFAGHSLRIGLAIRDYRTFWSAALAHHVWNGAPMPDDDFLDHLVTQPRRWSDVIRDIAAAAPRAELVVWCFETFPLHPCIPAQALTGRTFAAGEQGVPPDMGLPDCEALREALRSRGRGETLHQTDGVWRAFRPHQAEILQAQYHNDLVWLRAGADGLAKYIESGAQDAAPSEHDKRIHRT